MQESSNLTIELNQSLKSLRNEGVLVYPTDTVWGLGCDATNQAAVAKIYKIKQRKESKSLIILVADFEMLKKYINVIPKEVKAIIKESERPTTIIYNSPKGLATNVIAEDNTVAIRIVQNDFCKKLIEKFGKPIVSTSANISGKPTPKFFQEIDSAILDAVDYVVNLQQEETSNKPSRIIRITTDGDLKVLRD